MTTETISSGLSEPLKETLENATNIMGRAQSFRNFGMDSLESSVKATGYFTGCTNFCTQKHATGQLTFSTNKGGRAEFTTVVFQAGGSVDITRVISRGRDGNDMMECSWDYTQAQTGGEVVEGIIARMGALDPEGFGKYLKGIALQAEPVQP